MRTLLNMLLTVAAAAAFYVPVSTQPAPELGPIDNPAQVERVRWERAEMKPNVYRWTSDDAANYPQCRVSDGNFDLGDTLLVVDAWTGGAGVRSIETFDRVVEMSAENDADAYPGSRWNVIGYCS